MEFVDVADAGTIVAETSDGVTAVVDSAECFFECAY
jgi:hypothetical protein